MRWGLGVAWLTGAGAGLAAAATVTHTLVNPAPEAGVVQAVVLGAPVLASAAAGLVIATRAPGNRVALLGRRRLTHPVLAVLGAVDAVAFGIAPITYDLLGIGEAGDLFAGSLLLTVWVAAVGATALLRRRVPR